MILRNTAMGSRRCGSGRERSARAKETIVSLLKFFFSQSDLRKVADCDPLSHPDLANMSLQELADLPLMPENLGRTDLSPQPACRSDHPRSQCEGDGRAYRRAC
jgi:hypothetical protein